MKELKTTEGGASAVSEVMQRYMDQAVLETLIALVKDGLISLEEAAKRAHLTEEEFKEQMERNP